MARQLVPWRELGSPLRRMGSEMEDLMERFWGSDRLPWSGERDEFAPRLDIAETDKAFEVTVDLPGMKAEQVAVEVRNGNLWISGEKQEEKEEKGKTYLRTERHYGAFERVIPVPSAIDKERIDAEYKDGVLHIRLPKTEAVQPKHIKIKS